MTPTENKTCVANKMSHRDIEHRWNPHVSGVVRFLGFGEWKRADRRGRWSIMCWEKQRTTLVLLWILFNPCSVTLSLSLSLSHTHTQCLHSRIHRSLFLKSWFILFILRYKLQPTGFYKNRTLFESSLKFERSCKRILWSCAQLQQQCFCVALRPEP